MGGINWQLDAIKKAGLMAKARFLNFFERVTIVRSL